MRILIYLASAVIGACAVYMWSVRPIATPVILYGNEVEIIVHSKEPLPAVTQAYYSRKVAKPKYYAAFAIGSNNRSGWSGSQNSPADARATALAYCNHGGEGCEIYAELRPKGYDPKYNGMTVAQSGTKLFKRLGTRDGTFEYALSETGSWAFRSSKDWAILPALSVKRRCDDYAAKWSLPMHVPHGACQAYIGRVYSVKG